MTKLADMCAACPHRRHFGACDECQQVGWRCDGKHWEQRPKVSKRWEQREARAREGGDGKA